MDELSWGCAMSLKSFFENHWQLAPAYSMRGHILYSCFSALPLEVDDAVPLPSNVAMNTYCIRVDGSPSTDYVRLIHRRWASLHVTLHRHTPMPPGPGTVAGTITINGGLCHGIRSLKSMGQSVTEIRPGCFGDLSAIDIELLVTGNRLGRCQ